MRRKKNILGKINRQTVTDLKMPMFTEDWPTWQMLRDMRDFCLAKPSRSLLLQYTCPNENGCFCPLIPVEQKIPLTLSPSLQIGWFPSYENFFYSRDDS